MGLYRHIFYRYKIKYSPICFLDIGIFTDEGLGIYSIWTKYISFLPTLGGSASIFQPKISMNFLHSVLFNTKMGSEFFLFSATRLKMSKIDPSVILSSCKICEILPLLSPSILHHHILPLSILQKNS